MELYEYNGGSGGVGGSLAPAPASTLDLTQTVTQPVNGDQVDTSKLFIYPGVQPNILPLVPPDTLGGPSGPTGNGGGCMTCGVSRPGILPGTLATPTGGAVPPPPAAPAQVRAAGDKVGAVIRGLPWWAVALMLVGLAGVAGRAGA